jgi:hypothetical protein
MAKLPWVNQSKSREKSMPQPDFYHTTVKRALIKDGWTITDDPYNIEYKGFRLYADLGAEKPLGAEKGEHKIVVEIKVFGSASQITELEKAVGQYSIYRTILRKIAPERILYLAIADDIFSDFFQKPAIQDIVTEHEIDLLVFDPDQEVIVRWIQ